MNSADVHQLIRPDSPKQVTCSYCGETEIRDIGPCREPVELKRTDLPMIVREVAEKIRNSTLRECLNCRLVFRSPQPSVEELGQFYRAIPAGYWNYDPQTVGSWAVAKRFLLSHYDPDHSIRIVDVGSFNGCFLQSLPESWQKSAIEPSATAQQSLQANSITHLGDFIDDARVQDHAGTFDVVTMFDVFEHLPFPRTSLSAIVSLLKPGGRLLISTGDAHHWTWRLMGGQHWYLHSTQHLNFGNNTFFHRYCVDSDTKLERIVHHSHSLQGTRAAYRQSLETLHYWGKHRNTRVGSMLAKLIQSIPRMRYLKQSSVAPFGTAIADHILAVVRRPLEIQ